MKQKITFNAVTALVTVCIMQLIFTGMIYNPLSLYTAPIIEELQVSRTAYAMTLTVSGFICAACNMTLGWFKKKINLRGVLVMGGAIMTASMLVYSFATSIGMIYVSSSLCGIAFAYVASATGASVINAWYAKHSGLLVGITITMAGIGGTIFSPIIGSWIATHGWRHSFLIGAIICAVTTLLIGIFFRSEPATVGQKPAFYEEKAETVTVAAPELTGLTVKEGIKTPAFWVTAICWLLIGIIVYSIMGIIAIYVTDLGFDAAAAGAALSPMMLVNMILPLVLGGIADRIPVKWVVAAGVLLFTMACVIMLSEPTNITMVYLISIFTGCGIAVGRSTLPMQVRRVFGTKAYAGFIGIFVGIFSAGISIGGPIIAAFYDYTGTYATAMKYYIPVAIIVILAMIFLSDKVGKAKENK